MKIAARILLVLALVVGAVAITNFAYNAYMHASCSGEGRTNWLGIAFSEEDCAEYRGAVDERLRYDATAALVAAVFLIGSVQISKRIPKHRR